MIGIRLGLVLVAEMKSDLPTLTEWNFTSNSQRVSTAFCLGCERSADPEARARASGSEREMGRARASEILSRSEREK